MAQELPQELRGAIAEYVANDSDSAANAAQLALIVAALSKHDVTIVQVVRACKTPLDTLPTAPCQPADTSRSAGHHSGRVSHIRGCSDTVPWHAAAGRGAQNPAQVAASPPCNTSLPSSPLSQQQPQHVLPGTTCAAVRSLHAGCPNGRSQWCRQQTRQHQPWR